MADDRDRRGKAGGKSQYRIAVAPGRAGSTELHLIARLRRVSVRTKTDEVKLTSLGTRKNDPRKALTSHAKMVEAIA